MIKGKWILGNEDCTVPVKIRSEVFAGEFGLSGYGANKEDNYAMHAVLYDDSTPGRLLSHILRRGKVFAG